MTVSTPAEARPCPFCGKGPVAGNQRLTDASKVQTLQHIRLVARLLSGCICELARRQSEHDASKLEPPEVEGFAEWTPQLAASTYGSPEYHAMLLEMEPFLNHHYGVNKHHPEHWFHGIQGMDLFDLTEMLCDWYASASRHTNGDVLRSIEINQKRFKYSDDLKQILINTADTLKERESHG
jgi:hypothetical protein